MPKLDYYAILELPRTASINEVRQAYRRLARLYHPDSGEYRDNTKRFHHIQEAYATLSDGELKRRYDEELQRQENPRPRKSDTSQLQVQATIVEEEPPSGVGSSPAAEQKDAPQAASSDGVRTEREPRGRKRRPSLFNSVWDTFSFASAEPGVQKSDLPPDAGGVRPADGPSPLDPRHRSTRSLYQRIDGLESIQGCTRVLSLEYGDAVRNEEIRIPPGIRDGAVLDINFPEKGSFPRQSVKVRISIAPHPLVEREGLDITVKLPVTLSELLHGKELDVPAPGSSVKVKLPPNWDVRKRLRIKGRGISERHSKTIGDLYLRVYLVMPNTSNEQVRNLVEELERYYPDDIRSDIPNRL